MSDPTIYCAVEIPGEPYALKRHRTAVRGKRAISYDPKSNVEWKAAAAWHMKKAMGDREPMQGPVSLCIFAKFSCPKSQHRKREPRPSMPHCKRPDLDNVVKAVKDAATGVLWGDDSQVCEIRAKKVQGAQGEIPGVFITVARCDP